MPQLDDSIVTIYEDETHLRELHRWLTIGGSSGVLSGGAFFVPYGPIVMLLVAAAILFTPYLLWRLAQVRRYGWIVGFVLTVGLPALIGLYVTLSGLAGFFVAILPLVAFYAYTWLLRSSVGAWLEALRWKRLDAERRFDAAY